MFNWNYNNGYGFLCQLETDIGFYTIYSDEDRIGEPLFLEFHVNEDDYCTNKAVIIECENDRLEDMIKTAENHYRKFKHES